MTRLTQAAFIATTFICLLNAPAPVRAAAGPDRANGTVAVHAPAPSPFFERFVQSDGTLAVQYPANWRAYEDEDGVSFAPEGGIADLGGGRRALLYGLIVGQYDASGSVEEAAAGLVGQVLATHPYLRPRGGASRPQDAGDGTLAMTMSGRSALTGEEEWVTVTTRRLQDGRIVYAFAIVPGPQYDQSAETFAQMVRTVATPDERVRSAARVSE